VITLLTIKAINKPGYEAAADAELARRSELELGQRAGV
jgi:hypothetical protein